LESRRSSEFRAANHDRTARRLLAITDMFRRESPAARLFLAACWALLVFPVAHAADLEVRILSPSGDSPALGVVDVIVEVDASEAISSVSLLVDGLPSGQRSAPPFTFRVSLGEDNLSHRFEVEVATVGGARASASVVTPAIHIDEVVDIALQQVYVTVTNRRGERVLDLGQEDFHLSDDGRTQEIVTFAGGEIPFSALLLIDGSDSMRGAQIHAARAGARAFLTGMNDFDEAKVLVFSTRLLAASDFAGRYQPLNRLIEDVRPAGGTAINDFLFLGLQRLEQRQGRRVLVLLSDGWDVHSVLRMEQVAGIARQSQAQIFWLQLKEGSSGFVQLLNSWRDPPENRRQMRMLRKTIKESGGRIIVVAGPDEIEGAFQEVLAELREQYALGYYPDRRFDDGRWRRLEIDVDGSLKVKAREGYLDLP